MGDTPSSGTNTLNSVPSDRENKRCAIPAGDKIAEFHRPMIMTLHGVFECPKP